MVPKAWSDPKELLALNQLWKHGNSGSDISKGISVGNNMINQLNSERKQTPGRKGKIIIFLPCFPTFSSLKNELWPEGAAHIWGVFSHINEVNQDNSSVEAPAQAVLTCGKMTLKPTTVKDICSSLLVFCCCFSCCIFSSFLVSIRCLLGYCVGHDGSSQLSLFVSILARVSTVVINLGQKQLGD